MNKPTRTEAIKRFLNHNAHADLAKMYSFNMECQVNVAQDNGERVESDYKGRKWHGWTDGLTTWKSFRVPRNANTEPEYEDVSMSFDLEAHVEAIGMTGWDWRNKVSKWVAFDFDAIVGHSNTHDKKLTNTELEAVKNAAIEIPWVTVRKSTSGRGLHLYVMLPDVPTTNHTEHAALGRAILGKMSAISGFDFKSKVDACGGNMWIWHRKMVGTDGLTLIKDGEILEDVPPNWKDHVQVVRGSRKKNLPQVITEAKSEDEFETLTSQIVRVNLDEDHLKLIEYLKDTDAMWWWDQDHHMLVTHTFHLKEAHRDLGLRGYFNTLATGKEKGVDHNCFCFPLRRGVWAVRRYGLGVQEHESWSQDSAGWTRAYLNRDPDLGTVARAHGALENDKGAFIFKEAEVAASVARYLGANVDYAPQLSSRQATLKQHKDGRIIFTIQREPSDTSLDMNNWVTEGNKPWTRLLNITPASQEEPEVGNFDDLVRHVVTLQGEDYGWTMYTDGAWRKEPLTHVRVALTSMGNTTKQLNQILGSSIFKPWKLVNKPFQDEYPGDREWNKNAAQFRFMPKQDLDDLNYSTWSLILNHTGSGLDEVVKESVWCKANGITTGGDYLKCWIASLFQYPDQPLPYLFFYGPQGSGKSIFHEAISLLLTKGYKDAKSALTSQSGFNAEIEGAVLCYVEEVDLGKNSLAYSRIKEWVTGLNVLIHEKGKTPYHVPNTTHWCQFANTHTACPVFPGDTRITMCYVKEIEPINLIPKSKLLKMLEQEAPDFLASVLNLELPDTIDRLRIPVVTTSEKEALTKINTPLVDLFLEQECEYCDCSMILYSEFYERFVNWVSEGDPLQYTKRKLVKELPPKILKGRSRKNNQVYLGRIKWKGQESEPGTVKLVNDHLVKIDEN